MDFGVEDAAPQGMPRGVTTVAYSLMSSLNQRVVILVSRYNVSEPRKHGEWVYCVGGTLAGLHSRFISATAPSNATVERAGVYLFECHHIENEFPVLENEVPVAEFPKPHANVSTPRCQIQDTAHGRSRRREGRTGLGAKDEELGTPIPLFV